MNEQLANLVHPVLRYGLRLKDRLLRGETMTLDTEQTNLKALLLTELEAEQVPDFGGEALPERAEEEPAARSDSFLGVRYALTCWLDELFIINSPWEQEWTERKLESVLYGTNDRAWRFWQQARLAENRPSTDALEVFYLCVMLGFRGQLRESPDQLRSWCSGVLRRLTVRGDWPGPPDLEPPTQVPPLHGATRFRHALYFASMVILLLIPLAAFLLVQRLSE